MKYLKYMLLMLSGIGFAQTPISLEGAIQKASEKNLNLKSGQLRIDYQEKIKNAYKVIDPLNV